MDPYAPCAYNSDFQPTREQVPNSPLESSKIVFSQQQQQQQQQQHLPPFREILSTPYHSATEPSPSINTVPVAQQSTMTRRTFHPPSAPFRSDPPSPEHSQIGNSTEAFDNMSARSVDSTYPLPRHHRQDSSWTSASPYAEIASPYGSQQRMSCPSQAPFPSSRASPSLPPIRDLNRMNNFDSSFPSSTSSYPQAYGPSAGSPTGQDSFCFPTDRPAYYDAPHRYGHSYPQTNRPNAPQMDFPRYPPSPYDYRTGVAYQSPYGPVDYAPSPTGLHHPSSPTVAIDADTRNRRRRGNLPKQVTEVLRQWFLAHLDHPYPTEEEKQQFMTKTGLTIAQISNWFINARRRHLPALRQHARETGVQPSALQFDTDQLRRQQQQPDPTLR